MTREGCREVGQAKSIWQALITLQPGGSLVVGDLHSNEAEVSARHAFNAQMRCMSNAGKFSLPALASKHGKCCNGRGGVPWR